MRDGLPDGASAPTPWRHRLTARLPELCGLLWLVLLAGAVWSHTHATRQDPIYDGFSYYLKADNVWTAIRAGMWFNPLDVEPTFRPPGTVLMSYPFGFDPDPRGFYFRSVYLPALLLFLAVLMARYRPADDARARLRTVLTAVFFTTLTLLYHFEFGGSATGYWGLVDGFLAGLAAIAAASVWRGTRPASRTWIWAVAASLASALGIVVKPSGALVAAAAGVAWAALALTTLVEAGAIRGRRSDLPLRLLIGTALIGLTDVAMVAAALASRYLSAQNLAIGQTNIAIMKAELHLPLSQVWLLLNTGVGAAFLVWTVLAIAVCVAAGRAALTPSHVTALLAALSVTLFGIWFWFLGSGGATQIRYAVPFFMMAMVWLVPPVLRACDRAPALLRRAMAGVMLVAAVNLALLLLVSQPSLAWQQFSGVSITTDFPPAVLAALRRLVAQWPSRPLQVYVMSFDADDAILESIIDHARLTRPGDRPLALRRQIDWVRPSTFRIAEIAASDTLLINPQQDAQAPAGPAVRDLSEEQGVLTAWADRLGDADGVSVFYAAPTAKILAVVDPAKLRASLDRMVASHTWDRTFALANHLPQR